MTREYKPLRPGGKLSARDYNRLAKNVFKHDKITVHNGTNGGPLMEVTPDATGTHIRVINPGFWAQITDDTQPYTWQEVYSDGNGNWVTVPNGKVSTPAGNAYEWNSRPTPTGSFVWMVQSNDDEYWFNNGGLGTGGVTVTYVSDVTLEDCQLDVTYSSFVTTTLDSLATGLDDLGGLTGYY